METFKPGKYDVLKRMTAWATSTALGTAAFLGSHFGAMTPNAHAAEKERMGHFLVTNNDPNTGIVSQRIASHIKKDGDNLLITDACGEERTFIFPAQGTESQEISTTGRKENRPPLTGEKLEKACEDVRENNRANMLKARGNPKPAP